MDTARHAGKRALVSGAASGIGLAIAGRLVAEGASVIGLDIDEVSVPGVTGVRADVTDDAAVRQAVAGAGRIDILVNNAGVMDHFLPLAEMSDEVWERVLGVDLGGPMRLTRAALPGMLEAGGGAIVTIGSEGSLRAGVSGAAYTSAKHGLLGLVKHVAYFYGPQGIRSNAVLPGGVNTGIGASAAPQSQWAYERAGLALASMPGMAEPDQIAAAVSWLASDEASNVNGAVLAADGGWSAG